MFSSQKRSKDMANLVNAYTVHSQDIKPGDEMCFVVKAIVTSRRDGKLRYRLYRCQWEGAEDDIPQGSRMNYEETVCIELFPSLAKVGKPDY